MFNIPGAGNSSKTIQYSAIDYNPLPGKSHYRLKQTDADGQFTYYSNIISVENTWGNASQISLSPNPGNGQIKITNNGQTYTSVRILNISGILVASSTVTGNTITLPANLTSGIYIIQFYNGSQLVTTQKYLLL